MPLHPLGVLRPGFALAETAALGIAVWALTMSWSTVFDVNAFDVPLSETWSANIRPDEPRIGVVLLIVAIGSAVCAWMGGVRRFRTARMVVLLLSAAVPASILARALRAGGLEYVGFGQWATGAAFLAAALAAASMLRLPVFLGLAPPILGGAALLGYLVEGGVARVS